MPDFVKEGAEPSEAGVTPAPAPAAPPRAPAPSADPEERKSLYDQIQESKGT